MKLFYHNYNNVLNDVLSYYETTTNLLEADVYLTWNDLVPPQKKIVELCKKYGKRSIVVEHGMKAVSDYQRGLKDIHNNMGGKPLTADKICVWGNASKKILLDSGVDKNKISVIGSPIMWRHEYLYKSEDGQEVSARFNVGESLADPETGITWRLKGCKSFIPQQEDGKIIAYFPHHDFTSYAAEKNRLIHDEIKHMKNVYVKLSGNYMARTEENPFLDLLNIKNDSERLEKVIGVDTTHPRNLELILNLLRKTKVLVTTIPGTINGIAAAMGVPCVVPKIDWHWRDKKGEIVYDHYDCDYICEVKDLQSTIEKALKKDTKIAKRLKFAENYMGTKEGNPTKNIRRVVDGE